MNEVSARLPNGSTPQLVSRRAILGVAAVGALGIAAGCAKPQRHSDASHDADVVVYGGTPAGIMAAITIASHKLRALLVLGESPLGGMMTNGLSFSDVLRPGLIGGRTRQFFVEVGGAYGANQMIFAFEPHVALEVFQAMLRRAGVHVVDGSAQAVDVAPTGSLNALRLDTGLVCRANTFIDASYEGQLLRLSPAPKTYGRESIGKYGESLAGFGQLVQLSRPPANPSLQSEDVRSQSVPAKGSGDKLVQAYAFRLCVSDDPHRRIPFARPSMYDADRFAAVYKAGFDPTGAPTLQKLPGGKFDLNTGGGAQMDYLNGNVGFPVAATRSMRSAIADAHVSYQKGMLYFLANDPRVEPSLRDRFASLGLAADEFTASANWPAQLYVRESLRLVGKSVIVQNDIQNWQTTSTDNIALASYSFDCHAVQRYQDRGRIASEGLIPTTGVAPTFGIPLDALRTPRCPNLLVPVCMSASHVAYNALRLEAVYMQLGEAAGAAAVGASETGRPAVDVPVADVRALLAASGAILAQHP